MGTRSKRSVLPVLFALAIAALPGLAGAGTDAEDARAASEKASREVLQRLFTACPGARDMLRASEGFATFAGVGEGAGTGVAKPTRTRMPVYIHFESAAGSAGKRDLVFIFKSRDDFSRFVVKGAKLGGPAEAGAQGDCSQGLVPGVRVIQLEEGKLAGGDVPGAKYSSAHLN